MLRLDKSISAPNATTRVVRAEVLKVELLDMDCSALVMVLIQANVPLDRVASAVASI
jgi:hypothetical protein